MLKISIIIPVYKVEAYLRSCVDSVLAQTYSDFEIILVDDGSPDNCGAICDEYAAKDPRIRAIHRENGGLSAARNTGFAQSNGAYVTFLDSDDLLHPEFLARLFGAVRETDADIALCGFMREETALANWTATKETPELISGEEACLRLSGLKNGAERLPPAETAKYVVAWSKLYRRELLALLPYPVGRKHEDEFTTYRYLWAAKRVAVLPDQLYFYRPNSGGIMANRDLRSRRDFIDAAEERIAFYRAQGHELLESRTRSGLSFALADYALAVKAAGQKNDLPREQRVPAWKALRQMYYNTPKSQFARYLDQAYPRMFKPLRKLLLDRKG